MSMSRAQMEEQIKGFSTAGEVSIFDSPAYKDYEETLRQIRERDRTSADDVTTRVQELQQIFQMTQPRRQNIYDLSTALSKGITENAKNRASPLGYGLAAGFNLFSDAANQTREEKRKLQQELGMLAYKQLEQERKDEAAIDQLLAEQKLEVLLEQMKLGGAYFPGKDVKSQILNTLLRGEADPKFKETPEYKIAKAEYEKITRNIVQTEGGAQIIEQVPRRVDEIFGPSTSPAVTAPPQVPGYTYEGIGKDGDHYYRKDGTNEYIKLPSNKVSP
tara:strand:+ start:436 stop:1260 length:825 start_codon:yes stop_codon:yes gene_type:complete